MFLKCLVRQESTICSLKALRYNPQKRCRYLQLRTISTSQYVNNNKQVEVVSEEKTEEAPVLEVEDEENVYKYSHVIFLFNIIAYEFSMIVK